MAHRIANVTAKRNSLGAWDATVTIRPKIAGRFSWAIPCSLIDRRDARDLGIRQARDFLAANTSEGTILLTAGNSIYF